MAGSDSHRQLLALIRDYSTEKTQGERRIMNGKKRIEELISQIDASNKELEEAKREKEAVEHELRGYEVELSMNEASIQALEARIALTNNEISTISADLAVIKSEENSLRDEFIGKMLELNAQIRKFQELIASVSNVVNCSEAMDAVLDSYKASALTAGDQDSLQTRMALENKLAEIISQTNQEEQQYEAEKVIHDQLQQELTTSEKRVLLVELVMRASMDVQELRRAQELDEEFAALGDELQKRCICPNCHKDNSAEFGEILQTSNES